jgi:hypothetical protein
MKENTEEANIIIKCLFVPQAPVSLPAGVQAGCPEFSATLGAVPVGPVVGCAAAQALGAPVPFPEPAATFLRPLVSQDFHTAQGQSAGHGRRGQWVFCVFEFVGWDLVEWVGLSRVVREVRQHPDDHELESQQWQ